jgi:spermidine/putrescine transport system substrate-binding protein
MTEKMPEELRILAPREVKPKLDYLHREVVSVVGGHVTRRQALGMAGLAALAVGTVAACGDASTTTDGGSSSSSAASPSDTLSGKPIESQLEIFNWSEYDDPSTYTKFKKLPDVAAAGTTVHETYYSSNDELLAKLNAGGSSYDVIVPTQNAVAQLIQEGKLMQLDAALLPNLKNVDPAFLKPSYDPTGQYHVVKDYGFTCVFYNNKVVTDPIKTMKDFYDLLGKYSAKGRTNIMDGAEEVVPLALMALGLDANTDKAEDFSAVTDYLLKIRPGVTTIDSSGYIDDASAGKIILGQGWSGDVRRVVQARKKQGDITAVVLDGKSEIWADNWCIPSTAPHPVAAHAWINWLLTPDTAVTEMAYHNYPIPMPAALSQASADLKSDPLFNLAADKAANYQYILNVSPEVVQQRTKIYTQFKAAG